MATYLPKKRNDITRSAIRRLEQGTGIRATTVGSIARAFTEAITSEIADFYDILDYNVSQSAISTASGRHLDMIGALYDVERATISDSTRIARESNSFYFYIDEPATSAITIPKGTAVYTSSANFVGNQLSFETTEDVVIPQNETKVFAGLRPTFATNEVTAARGTLVTTNAGSPSLGVTIKATNPKPIYSQKGYESDNNYRARIIKRMAVQATGSLDAIRYSLLGMANVRDVSIRSARLGLGVVEVMVVPEENAFTSAEIRDISGSVNAAKPGGVRAIVTSPDRLEADINAMLFLRQTGLQPGDQETIMLRCRAAWRNYINSLLPGDALVYNRLIDIALGVSDKIVDVMITNFGVGGSSSIRSNYTPKSDQMIVPGNIDIVTSLFS